MDAAIIDKEMENSGIFLSLLLSLPLPHPSPSSISPCSPFPYLFIYYDLDDFSAEDFKTSTNNLFTYNANQDDKEGEDDEEGEDEGIKEGLKSR